MLTQRRLKRKSSKLALLKLLKLAELNLLNSLRRELLSALGKKPDLWPSLGPQLKKIEDRTRKLEGERENQAA